MALDGYLTTKQVAEKWNVSERKVSDMCRNDEFENAEKIGGQWRIPEVAVDTVNVTIRKRRKKKLLPLPIGVSDYKQAVSEYYYVDKTELIKEFIDEKPKVCLFTRPRRFGKTLNMNMLRVFFEKTTEDTSICFKDKNIWKYGKEYQNYQGKYPVIQISFKDVKFSSWNDTFNAIRDVIATEAYRHSELLDSSCCNEYEKLDFEKILQKDAGETELSRSLSLISRMLYKHYGIGPVIIIDEYDIPIQQGHIDGYYDNVISFMRNLFSGAFKDNQFLSFGFLTGVLRVAKESVFSGLNNLQIYSVIDTKYSKYFGFTNDEVKAMARYYGKPEKYKELCEWYDGYKFGNTDIFNPWSVINYFSNECEPRAFWQSTGNNDVIKEILTVSNPEIYDNLTSLIQGKEISSVIDTNIIYPEITNNPSSIYSFLLMSGYLKVTSSHNSLTGDYLCTLAIPNKEIDYVYRKEILSQLENIVIPSVSTNIQLAFLKKDANALKNEIQKLLLTSVSSHDTAKEIFYHGLMLGICTLFSDYILTSNREAGEGRYDIQLKPKDKQYPGILIELKAEKSIQDLTSLSKKALEQIKVKKYDMEMKSEGINTIFAYGVAFSGKKVEVTCEEI